MDKYNLFKHAHDERVPGLPGTWVGHIEQYNNQQVLLRNLIKTALQMGCKVPDGAFELAYKTAPTGPDPARVPKQYKD